MRILKTPFHIRNGVFLCNFVEMEQTKLLKLYAHFLQHPIVTTDTRKIVNGGIFFALKGEHFDGNSFAINAIAEGASLAVVDDVSLAGVPGIFLVDDVLLALQALANHHRRQMPAKVLAITGSNGKTTTKELVAAVLSTSFKTVATQGNLNNHIGVPLTLLRMNIDTEIAIIEMGANHLGEIARLCEIALPDIGMITNIGKAHLEGFGSLEGVTLAKTELYRYIGIQKGTLIVNADNPLLMNHAADIACFTYGTTPQARVSGSFISAEPFVHFEWEFGNVKNEIKTNLIGAYNLENLLAAVATACYFGVDYSLIGLAISQYMPSNSRSQMMQTAHNRIVLDAYNANPVSMAAAIRNFAGLKPVKPLLILGDMLELGSESPNEHQQIIQLLGEMGFKDVFLVGKEFLSVEVPYHFKRFADVSSLGEALSATMPKGFDILLKGSRGIRLEKVLELL